MAAQSGKTDAHSEKASMRNQHKSILKCGFTLLVSKANDTNTVSSHHQSCQSEVILP